MDAATEYLGFTIEQVRDELRGLRSDQHQRQQTLDAMLNKIRTALNDDVGHRVAGVTDELRGVTASLDEIREALDYLKETLNYSFPQIGHEIFVSTILIVGCAAVGMIAILGTLRHWF